MGKTGGTKMGAYMTLTDEDVKDNESGELLGKKFNLSVDMGGMLDDDDNEEESNSSLSSSSSSYSSSSASSEASQDDASSNFYGYYTLGGTDLDGSAFSENHLCLGTTMIGDYFGISLNIPNELIELVIYAEIDQKTLNIYIPVSLTDLQYQLYWYGYRVDTTNFTLKELHYDYYNKRPTIGSHPSAAEIARIREHEQALDEEDNPFANFRDYHTLTMGLLK